MSCEAFGIPLEFFTILFGFTTLIATFIAIYLAGDKKK